nr:putative ribonuclease H-like domain-containing protein [Tanacetum cinerariifolium]
MRNKERIDELYIDDLYNNLKVFKANIKGSYGSSSNSHNVAFLFVEVTNSIDEVNTANGVSTAAGHSSSRQASSSSYTEDLMFSFFANGLGYDWSYIAHEEPTEFTFMAYSSGSDTKGNSQQALKYKGMFDSGCSKHMTGHKALLTDYQDIKGGFVAFGGSTKGANLTTEAEYIAASHCCGQVLWIQNQMMDYGYNFMLIKIHVDNESAIYVIKNHVYHFKTKHIKIRHHFIRDSYEKRLIEMVKIHTDNIVANLHSKSFD